MAPTRAENGPFLAPVMNSAKNDNFWPWSGPFSALISKRAENGPEQDQKLTVLKLISGPVGETCSQGSLHGTLVKELDEMNQMAGLTFCEPYGS